MKPARILVVDDEPGIRQSLCGVLGDDGYLAHAVASGEESLEDLSREPSDLVLLDVWLPGIDGMETLARIQEIPFADRPVVVMISGHGNIETAVKATKLGAFDFLEKPLSLQKLTVVLKNALEHRRLQIENIRLRGDGESKYRIIGESVPMKALRQQMELMAATNGRVLIYGESGTGKELVARAIHRHSPRRERPFVAVSCAAIPETLIESELFGYEKGAFTGAASRRQGLLEAADRSTLFFDEIGELSANLQAKVLRALQEREIRRVGGREDIKVDVRILAATNKSLEAEVARGTFREDLYYRLHVVTINLPPLRERSTDIPELAEVFVARVCAEAQRPPMPITKEAMGLLLHYEWPGNVRQLEAVLQRAVLLSDGRAIDYTDLPIEVRFSTLPPKAPVPASGEPECRFPLPQHGINLEEVEREFIVQAMEQSGWVIAKAAKLLGLSYRTLQYRLEKFQIRREGDEAASEPDATG